MPRTPVYMPKYGMTMTEGLIAEWYFAEGETVKQGQPLLAVETEKVAVDLEAPASGTLVDIRFNDQDEAPVGEIIAYIETGD